MSNEKKFHPAWLILIGCCINNCGTSGIINCIGLFYKPVASYFTTETNPVGVSDVAMGRTLQIFVAAVFIFFGARSIFRKYYKASIITSSILYAAHYVALSFCTSLRQMYIIQFLCGFPISIIHNLCVFTTLNRWFIKKKGTAISISAACSGLSSILISAVTGNIIDKFGWAWGYRFFGLITFVTTVTSTVFFLRESPEKYGLKPYGWDPSYDEQMQTNYSALSTGKVNSVFKRKEFYYILFLSCAFQFLIVSTSHMSSYATSLGYGVVASAYISSLSLAGNTSIKLLIGILRDKIGTRNAGFISFAILACGYILLILNLGFIPLLIGVFMVGSGMSTATIIAPVSQSEFFKGKDFDIVYPFHTMISQFISAFANFFYGWIYDKNGTYTPIFIVCFVILVVCTADLYVLNINKTKTI